MGCLGDEGLNWGSWEVETEAEWVRIIAGASGGLSSGDLWVGNPAS